MKNDFKSWDHVCVAHSPNSKLKNAYSSQTNNDTLKRDKSNT